MKSITPIPLSPIAFAPFGDVISVDEMQGVIAKSANQGSAQRFDFAAHIDNQRADARANVALFVSAPRTLPFRIEILERHPHSSQLFAPLSVSRYLVVVAGDTADGEPDLGNLHVFSARAGQCINYKKGTWHHPLIVFDRPAEFLMLSFECGNDGDAEERVVTPPLPIAFLNDRPSSIDPLP